MLCFSCDSIFLGGGFVVLFGGWERRGGCQSAFSDPPKKVANFLRIFVEEQLSDDDEM